MQPLYMFDYFRDAMLLILVDELRHTDETALALLVAPTFLAALGRLVHIVDSKSALRSPWTETLSLELTRVANEKVPDSTPRGILQRRTRRQGDLLLDTVRNSAGVISLSCHWILDSSRSFCGRDHDVESPHKNGLSGGCMYTAKSLCQ